MARTFKSTLEFLVATRKPPAQPPKRKNVAVNRGGSELPIKAAPADAEVGEQVKRTGRPPKWTQIQLEYVTNLCLLGLTNEELGRHFNLAGSTIDDWVHGRVKDPTEVAPFVQAIKDGREGADAKVAGSLYARAVGYEYDEQVAVPVGKGEVTLVTVRKKLPPDVAAAFIWLKNRRRKDWKDKHEDTPQDPTAAAKVIQDAVAAALATTGSKPEGDGDAEGGAV